MAYPPIATPYVISQPKQYDIHSNFAMFAGERLLYHGEMKTGCCKLGDNYFTSVTDTRYISRQVHCLCCCCCCKKPYIDTCIYFDDIGQLEEVREGMWCCVFCYKTYPFLCCCRCLIPKRLQLRGSFGTHTIHIDQKKLPDFELMFAEAIAQHKRLDET